MKKEEMELEFINSFGLEDYLDTNNEMDDKDFKLKVSNFLTPYLNQNLYAVEYIRADRVMVLQVENEDDEKIDSIDLYEIKYEVNTKELIKLAFAGEISENELMTKLKSRSDEQVINDLLECNTLEGLLNTRDCIESGIENNPELDTDEVKKSLKHLYRAIKLKCDELILCEKKVKEMLCN